MAVDSIKYGPPAGGSLGEGDVTTTEILDDTITTSDIHDVTEADFSFSDNTTANASTTKHGLVVKATAPAANVLNVVGIANGETAYTNKSIFDGTAPADLGTAAAGTSLVAAHRDHVHTLPKLDDLAAPDDNTDLDASTTKHGLLKKLDNNSAHFLDGQGNWSTPGGSATQDLHYYKQVGTSPLEIWYPVNHGQMLLGVGSTRALAANTLYAAHHICTRTATIDRIAICTTVTSADNAQNCRLGIYTSTSATNLYPDALVLDAGTVNLSTSGALAITVNQQLTANTLYWFVLVTSQADATVRAGGSGSQAILGFPSTLPSQNTGSGLTVSFTYGTLPSTFPASAAIDTSNIPAIYVRYSA